MTSSEAWLQVGADIWGVVRIWGWPGLLLFAWLVLSSADSGDDSPALRCGAVLLLLGIGWAIWVHGLAAGYWT